MLNNKPDDRSDWVVQREYRDSSGIMQTEYRDSSGNIHTEATDPNGQAAPYQSGYVDGKLVEDINQNQRARQADKDTSKGLLIGVIVACVVGVTAGVAYYLFQLNNPSDPILVNTPIYRDDPTPEPTPEPSTTVIERTVTNNVTPAEPTETEPQDVNVTVKNESEEPKAAEPKPAPQNVNVTVKNESEAPKAEPKAVQPKPAPQAAKPPAQPAPQAQPIAPMAPVAPPSSANNSPVATAAKTDAQLKTEIVKQFNQQLASNQLSVDVNQGNVRVNGTVSSPEQLEKIQPLLRSIAGVNTVDVKVTLKNPAN